MTLLSSSGEPLALTMGDPAGVGPVIARAAWRQKEHLKRHFFVLGDSDVMRGDQVSALCPVAVIGHPGEARAVFGHALPVLHIPCPPTQPGHANTHSAGASLEAIRLGVDHVRAGAAAALVTNPVNKALLASEDEAFAGHTEYLARLCDPSGKTLPVMMLVGGGLRIALATTHMSLRDAIARIDAALIVRVARILAASLSRWFGLDRPRLALAALNPHAGENGLFGHEENDILAPAASRLRAEGIAISDPISADSLFHHARNGQYDAVIALYHDQGLIPVKTLDFWNGVNVTLGLDFVRTSPDHGVAYSCAAEGNARPDSLLAALDLAALMADCR